MHRPLATHLVGKRGPCCPRCAGPEHGGALVPAPMPVAAVVPAFAAGAWKQREPRDEVGPRERPHEVQPKQCPDRHGDQSTPPHVPFDAPSCRMVPPPKDLALANGHRGRYARLVVRGQRVQPSGELNGLVRGEAGDDGAMYPVSLWTVLVLLGLIAGLALLVRLVFGDGTKRGRGE